ncbi:MAG: CBS domain-containing protein [Candidatus Caldarchaeum sp.]|nr:CBS domain-containing protein [Candidatus Caldarchaeum sp.]
MPVFKRAMRYSPLKAADLMSSPPVTIGEEATIDDVSKLMWDKGVGSVLIVNRENKLIGIITERDILYAASHLMFGKDVKARSLMSKNLVTAAPDDEIVSVVEKMKDFNIRHIPVVDPQGSPMGVISSRDLLDFGVRLLSLFIRSS